jgi:trehalose 6-phosphate phosphatase
MIPQPLFDRRGILDDAARRRITACKTVVLFLDFDGTLAPIRKAPSLAVMPQRTKGILASLARRPEFVVGLATGRTRADIVRKVGLKGLFLITNHGFEISRGKTRWVHPAAKRARPGLTRCAAALRRSLRAVRGTLIEHKGYTLSVHFRNVSKAGVPIVHQTVAELLLQYGDSLKSAAGKKVLEIRPRVLWGKGHAALRVLQSLRRSPSPLVLYIGDDVTDEDAFRLLPRGAITIAVGRYRSAALYRVKNPGDVVRFLQVVNNIGTRGVDS